MRRTTNRFKQGRLWPVSRAIILFILLSTSCLSKAAEGFPPNVYMQAEALTALYNATDGANWANKTNWLNGMDPCDAAARWFGVTCDGSGEVARIVLESNGLHGFIPAELADLTNLTDLDLSDNQLTGNIPPELGNLTQLRRFNLYANQLGGSIPPQLGNLNNLAYLDLGANQLRGGIPSEIGNLNNLLELYLDGNQLSGAIPSALGNLTTLELLFLSDNQLSCFGSGLSALCNTGLQINLDNNLGNLNWNDFCSTGAGTCSQVLASPAIFLQGPYDIDAGLMRDLLRANGLLPLSEPFTDLDYIHIGGGGESAAQAVFNVDGPGAVVDWVFLELRDKTDSDVIVATRSALLRRDGRVVDVDGSSPVSFSKVAVDEYYLVVKHRNHLGVMSAFPIAFSTTAVMVDFTNDINKIFGAFNGVTDLGDGFLGLYSGDFNHSGQIQNTDFNFMIPTLGVPAGYLPGDHDLNGQVQNTDLQLKLIPNIGRGQPFGQ